MRTEDRIDALILEGNLSKLELAGLIRSCTDISKITSKLKTKETKEIQYTSLFIDAYLSTVQSAKYPSYKECSLLSLGECACAYASSPVLHTEIADLKYILATLKKSTPEETKKIVGKLTELVISSGDQKTISSAVLSLENLETQKPIEYAHALYAMGHHYEAFKAIKIVAKIKKLAPSADKMRLHIMLRYFLHAENYRGYLNCIDRLQHLGVEMSPVQSTLEYAKYQKIICDYDSMIRYTPGVKSELKMQYPTVFTLKDTLWRWYVHAVNTEEPIADDSLEKISFMRKNRLAYSVAGGVLSVHAGNTSHSLMEYISDLSFSPARGKTFQAPKRTEQEIAFMEAQSSRATPHTKVQPQAATLHEIANPERAGAKTQSSALGTRSARSKAKHLFDEKEYYHRKTLSSFKNSSTEPSEESPLHRVNQRFQLAHMANVEILKQALAIESLVDELLSQLPEPLPEPEPAVSEMRREIPMCAAATPEYDDFDEEEREESKPAQYEAKQPAFVKNRTIREPEIKETTEPVRLFVKNRTIRESEIKEGDAPKPLFTKNRIIREPETAEEPSLEQNDSTYGFSKLYKPKPYQPPRKNPEEKKPMSWGRK